METLLLQLLTSLAIGTASSLGATQASNYINGVLSRKKDEGATLDEFIEKPKPPAGKAGESVSDIANRAMRP